MKKKQRGLDGERTLIMDTRCERTSNMSRKTVKKKKGIG